MSISFQGAVAAWLIVLAATPIQTRAQAPRDALFETALDIDDDGKIDRAALVRDAASETVDLLIYLGVGDGRLDLSKPPTFLKKDIASNIVLGLDHRGKSLIVTYGCGGCSNDYTTRLTIVRRRGEFLIAGYSYDWERSDSVGRCEINFLTGKGAITRGVGTRSKALKGKFAPAKLADWSIATRPRACAL